ncbi:undecaprenyl-phosphate galactose phosphotransferase WbaP [Actinobacillus equuli]|uniref:undecaprenyl-phosphate galactose phosphotransferase WbaP n=1 Tax=Actinobacillus equuli TaxID=718 RepID=UPI0024467704|nr:undecaprenyl-phosphate galactose phosphotransferase WbaP [Actinobacillus equuli]WGE83402.1 undecaprenyl-phosphate galactose phosphotransferase WbaP [Actinobacillus equuli subsp. equuli]
MNNDFYSKLVLSLFDFISLVVSFFFSINILYVVFDDLSRFLPSDELQEVIFTHLFLSFVGVSWFGIRLRHYTYRKPFWLELKEVIRTILILAIIELAIFAFSKLYLSRYLWGITWVLVLISLPLIRVVIRNILRRIGIYLKNTVIIGGGQNALDSYNALISEPYLGFKVKAFIVNYAMSDLRLLNISVIEESNKATWASLIKQSDQIIIALEDHEIEARDKWLRYFSKHNYRSVSVIPTLRGLPLYSTDMSFLFSYEVMLLRVNNNLAKRSSRILKRSMDILGSLALIIGLSPLLVTLYILIKKDGGNAIYGHRRIGQNGKPFDCLKFRSMVVNSKEVLEELLAKDAEARAEWEKDFKLKNDPRVTKIGAFIRKTSLDELPQLFNVLKGEMSLVGPRPIVADELARYEEDVDYYLMAKPGMTGLWQVSGRNDVDYETRVYFDSWYVKNWSLWNDIAILFKTITAVRKRAGAY